MDLMASTVDTKGPTTYLITHNPRYSVYVPPKMNF